MSLTAIANALLLAAAAYLLGSLPFGLWIGRWRTGGDIRRAGSGHSGATNAMRQAGWGVGALVLALDLAKGYLAGWLAQRYGLGPLTLPLAAAAVVAGHCWPCLAGFRGGMGMATAGGFLLAIYPLGFALGIGLAALLNLLLRHTARAVVVGGVLLGPLIWLFSRSAPVALAAAAAGAVLAVRFSADWRRVYRELWLDRER